LSIFSEAVAYVVAAPYPLIGIYVGAAGAMPMNAVPGGGRARVDLTPSGFIEPFVGC
jgi:hypothetical protein